MTEPWAVLKGFGFGVAGIIPRFSGPSQVARFAEATDPPFDTVKVCVGQNGDTAAVAGSDHIAAMSSNARCDARRTTWAQLRVCCFETNCIISIP